MDGLNVWFSDKAIIGNNTYLNPVITDGKVEYSFDPLIQRQTCISS